MGPFRMGTKVLSYGVLVLAISFPSSAAVIYSDTQTWTEPSRGWQVELTTTVFDNFRGDFTKEEWQYTLHNISFVGDFHGSPTAIEAFDIYLGPREPGGFVFVGISEFYGPPGWHATRYLLHSLRWLAPGLRPDPSTAIWPGSTGVFGFSVALFSDRPPWLHQGPSWIGSSLGVAFSISPELSSLVGDQVWGTLAIPLLVPEPSPVVLTSAGIVLLVLFRRKRRA